MGAKVRGITIELSADATGISSGLKAANSAISATGRELKDINKLLKLDPTNVTLLAQKHEALQRQIANTRDKLDLLKKAEEDLKAQMVDGGTEEQKRQLEALQREIISTEKDLDKYTSQMDEAGDETKELARSEEQATKAAGQMNQGFTVLKATVANLLADGLRKVAEEVKDLLTEGPKYADQIVTLASKTSIATDQLQELSYMSGLVDVDVNTVAKSMQKLTKNMSSAAKGSGSAYDAFQQLGVSITDVNGNLRDNEDVFYDALEALGKIENETERDAIAMNLFGKSATDLNPMIEAGSEKLKEFAQEAHDMGYVLDEDALEALSRVQDEFDRFDRQMTSVKNKIASGLAPAVERGMKRINRSVNEVDWEKWGRKAGDALEKLIDVFEWILDHGNEVKAILTGVVTALAVQKVAQFTQGLVAMTSTLRAATTAQEGMNAAANANPYVLLASVIIAVTVALGSYVKSVTDAAYAESDLGKAIDEIDKRMEEHEAAVQECADAYAAMDETRTKAIEASEAEASHLQKLTDELGTLVDANGQVADGDKARAEFILNELNNALGTEYDLNDLLNGKYQEMAGSVYQLIEAKRVEAIMAAQEAAYTEAVTNRADAELRLSKIVADQEQNEIALQAAVAERDALEAQYAGNMDARTEDQIHKINDLINAYEDEAASLEDSYKQQADTVNKYLYDIDQYEANWEAAHEGHYENISTVSYETAKAMGQDTKDYAAEVAANTTAATTSWRNALAEQLSEATGRKYEFVDVGNGLIQAYVDGQKQGEPMTVQQVLSMNKQIANHLRRIQGELAGIGGQIPAGIAEGIYSGSGTAYSSMVWLANNMLAAFNNTMAIHSPSKKMEQAMGYAIEGAVVGIRENEGQALNEMTQFGTDLVESFVNPMDDIKMPSVKVRYGDIVTGSGAVSTRNARITAGEGAIVAILQKYLPDLANRQILLDGKKLVGELAPEINSGLGKLQAKEARGI